MAKIPVKDVIVLLPGILGSVLQKDGGDLWEISLQALRNLLPSPNTALQQLKLVGDDPTTPDLGDGITAPRLIQGARIIPGLWKIDGYGPISSAIQETFAVKRGELHDKSADRNYFEFPYDWRRDNRFTAGRLKEFIDERLKIRQSTGAKDVKVILLAHSMGGLVARYYLEVLDGWKDCRGLITFGTPYRGSIKALNFLANGYKNRVIDLTDVVRSFTSVYQLLPIYEAVKAGEEYRRVSEITIPNVDLNRTRQALTFHRKIERAVKKHVNNDEYRRKFQILPIVGTRQPTLQSAELSKGGLTVSNRVPAIVPALLEEGDGTVPRVSATPIELSDKYQDSFYAERHAAMQNNRQILAGLFERLKQSQVSIGPVRGPEESHEAAERPAISVLNLEDSYEAGEPVIIRAKYLDLKDDSGRLTVKLVSTETGDEQTVVEFQRENDEWVAVYEGLGPGIYRIKIKSDKAGPEAPLPLTDIFEVTV